MSIGDWLRNLISGQPHINDAGEDDPGEVAADLYEESMVADPPEDDAEPEQKPSWDFPSGGRHA